MIHGKKRNKDLFRRLTESWGYTKDEEIPLDEQVAASEEEEEVQEEGVYKADEDREAPDEVEESSNPRQGNEDRIRDGRGPADRMHEVEEIEAEEELEENAGDAGVDVGNQKTTDQDEDETGAGDALEETIRRVVTRVLNDITTK